MCKQKLDRYGWRYIITMIILPFFHLGLFVLIAQQTNFARLWLFFATNLVILPASAVIAARYNPEILNYRGQRRKKGIKTWDKILVHLFGIFGFHLPIVIAALDMTKYHWITFPLVVSILAVLIFIIGQGIFVWGMCVNHFFDTMVHIQNDRNHQVITSGPYQYVRHPGYIGAILWILSIPLILGSALALIPALIGCGVLVVRTYLEDNMLRKELDGYAEYANHVKYRLVTGIW